MKHPIGNRNINTLLSTAPTLRGCLKGRQKIPLQFSQLLYRRKKYFEFSFLACVTNRITETKMLNKNFYSSKQAQFFCCCPSF